MEECITGAGSADTTVRLWSFDTPEASDGVPRYGAEEASCLEVTDEPSSESFDGFLLFLCASVNGFMVAFS